MSDQEREDWPIQGVRVTNREDGEEYYEDGKHDVTGIQWGKTNGHMAHIMTVRVYKNRVLHSEHPFVNCLSVYYKPPTE